MGDVTIYLLLDSTLVGEKKAPTISSSSSSFEFHSTSHVTGGDASLSELMDYILAQLSPRPTAASTSEDDIIHEKDVLLGKLTLLDVSYNPAKVISNDVRQFTEVTGPNSKTLQSLGWFPSGKLVILPKPSASDSISTGEKQEEELLGRFLEWQARNVLQHEEFAYNNPDAAKKSGTSENKSAATAGVQWTGVEGGNVMKPSEIYTAVEQQRSNHDLQLQQANKSKQPKKKKPRRTEKQRTQRLDSLLQNLDAKSSSSSSSGKNKKGSKKKAVSQKVRTMLLKSRSEGNKKLRMEDRFHLEVTKLWDDGESNESENNDGETSYRFFSRQTTAGRVASTVASNLGNDKAAECLVSYPSSSSGDGRSDASNEQQQGGERRYRRLPNTMSLHDAQAAGWVTDFDVVVVRIYSLAGGNEGGEEEEFGPSKSVLDPDSDDEIMNDIEDGDDNTAIETGEASSAMELGEDIYNDTPIHNDETTEQSQQKLQQRMHAIFQHSGENDNKSKKKKKKPVSKQVRNILIKSKSTGNARIKQEDRVYLEVVVYHDIGTKEEVDSSCYSSLYRFFSKQNDIQHVLNACCGNLTPNTESDDDNAAVAVEFIVLQDSSSSTTNLKCEYEKLPTAMTLGDAVQKGYIEDFERVLVRICGDKS